MEKVIIVSITLAVGLLTNTYAQTQGAEKSTNGVVSQQGGTAKSNTSSVTGMKRKGSGKGAYLPRALKNCMSLPMGTRNMSIATRPNSPTPWNKSP